MAGSKGGNTDRNETVEAKTKKVAQPGRALETDDSPKRHGEKLQKARDAAAGKPTR